MKSKATLILSLIVLIIPLATSAQNIGIGEWREHLPYNRAVSVAAAGDRVYCATPFSLFYYNKSDNTLNRLSRVTGLNDQGVSKIGYNDEFGTLLIAYSNTNIDLVKNNVIINMPDILNSAAITPEERSINNILFLDQFAYLSCGFGIVVINVVKEEVVETYYIGPQGSHINVHDLTVSETHFFAATEEGIYVADRNNPNLAFYDAWAKDMTLPDPDKGYNLIDYADGSVFTNKFTESWENDTVYILRDGVWSVSEELMDVNVYDIYAHENSFHVALYSAVVEYNTTGEEIGRIKAYITNGYAVFPQPNEIDMDNSGMWFADRSNGLIWRESENNFYLLQPNGPFDSDVFDMSLEGNNLWIVRGGRDLSWNNLYKAAQISYLVDGQWDYITPSSEGASTLGTMHDLLCVAINPYNPDQVFAGSWTAGLVEFDNYQYDTLYTPENSSLGYRLAQGAPICKVGGLAFDNEGNLWVTNSGATNVLSVRMNDGSELGEWRSFYLGNQGTSEMVVGPIIIDSYGQKWIMRPGKSLIVFSDGGTINSPGDDQVKFLSGTVGNGNIPGTKVYSIAEDNDGEIWIGTDEGIAVIYSPENVFNNQNYDAQQILIPRNDGTGLADILLEFESISAIAVDGANNKWIGTERSGVYLFSPDGLQEIHHFTMDNSPLLSNNITSIVINESGEVFFGTSAGIISYKGSATPGGTTYDDVVAYPNPVRPGYTGPIAVRGLVGNANFKITDVNGSLIYSGRAEGGQAVWNGTNFEGRRAQSGVYLVFVTNNSGTETLVTKILFMN